MKTKVYKGVVRGDKVVFNERARPPEGTEVLVTPLPPANGSPQVVLSAMKASPHLKPEDVEEFERLIENSKRRLSFESPLQTDEEGRRGKR